MSIARVLLVAVLMTCLLNAARSCQAWAGYKLDYPKEAFGFVGTLSAEVAKAPHPKYGWFEIKVVKVVKFGSKNKTKIKNVTVLTKVWVDKYVAVLGVKGMEELKVGDMVTVEVTNHEVHLRASKVTKDKAPDAETKQQ